MFVEENKYLKCHTTCHTCGKTIAKGKDAYHIDADERCLGINCEECYVLHELNQ